jgi:hypothetical protein
VLTGAAGAADLDALAEVIELQRLGCELAGSPLYAEVLDAVAADVAAGGPCLSVLAPHARAPVGDAVLLRLLAGVHHLVLAGRAPDLAAHYPSVGGTPQAGLGAAFVATVARHVDHLAVATQQGVQTNEVGRSVALLCGVLRATRPGLPVRLLEVGASAGLNLHLDRYRYEAAGWRFGPVDSPLVFVDPFVGRSPDDDPGLQVVARRGCDLAPIPPETPEGRRRLRSFVWPDQRDRAARLDAALEVASRRPVAIDRADAVTWLRRMLAEPASGVLTVVMHSITFQYLSAASRRALLTVLDDAGRRATPDAPLAWVRMEPGGDRAEVRLTEWPSGRVELVAHSAYHGPPVSLA